MSLEGSDFSLRFSSSSSQRERERGGEQLLTSQGEGGGRFTGNVCFYFFDVSLNVHSVGFIVSRDFITLIVSHGVVYKIFTHTVTQEVEQGSC